MTQPLQHQHADRPRRIMVIVPSRFFERGVAYDVVRWTADGCPWVYNSHGSKTWLLERYMWAPVPEPDIRARYRAERARAA